ncbi:DUF2807 domain-containing protein [Candidatus Bathyarchaeota archaeon]|nr:DUF2807 domain-containing protein [Candidatus Bathyarchaeota archaeon]
MNRKKLKTNTRGISTLVIALIIIIVVASVAVVVVTVVLLGYWKPLGQIVGSGTFDTEKKEFTDFTIVQVGWGFEVEINQSDSFSINIIADDNMFDYIEVSKTGDTLRMGLKLGYSYRDVTLRAEITMPELNEARFSGGTHGVVGGFTSTQEFVLDLSGGSHLSGDFTTSEYAQFTLSGGSHVIELDGAANDLTISGSGGSHLNLSEFTVHDATVNLSGGSHATINLDGILDGDLSGGSHLKYVGTPTEVDVNTSSDSSVGPQ